MAIIKVDTETDNVDGMPNDDVAVGTPAEVHAGDVHVGEIEDLYGVMARVMDTCRNAFEEYVFEPLSRIGPKRFRLEQADDQEQTDSPSLKLDINVDKDSTFGGKRTRQSHHSMSNLQKFVAGILSLLTSFALISAVDGNIEVLPVNEEHIQITPNGRESVAFCIPNLPPVAHYAVYSQSNLSVSQDCSKKFIEDNYNCSLSPRDKGPCAGLVFHRQGQLDSVVLEGQHMDPGTYKYCVLQQVPNKFIMYEFVATREPDNMDNMDIECTPRDGSSGLANRPYAQTGALMGLAFFSCLLTYALY